MEASIGRSVFYVYAQFPNEPDYLKRLREFPTPSAPRESDGMFLLSNDLPQFPAESQFILLRRTLLITATGEMVLSPLTESVQIRVYATEPSNREFINISEFSQEVHEFTLDRDELFNGEHGGMRLVTNDDLTLTTPPFGLWPSTTTDPLETPPFRKTDRVLPLQSCTVCHSGAGIRSVRSFNVIHRRLPTLRTSRDLTGEADRTMNWKEQRYSWGLLQGLWNDR
jgi:hypothetical protein